MQSQRFFLMNPLNMTFLKKKTARPVFQEMSESGLWFLLIFFLVALAIFLSLAIPAWKMWADLTYAGVSTQGEVVNIRFEDRDVSYFYVDFGFAANDLLYQNEMRVDFDQYSMVPDIGQPIPVRYVASNPLVSQLDTPFVNFGDFRVGGTLLGGGFLLMLLIALLLHGSRRLRNSTLVAQGKVLEGKVVSSHGVKPERDGMFAQMLTLFFARGLYYLRRQKQSEFRVKVRYSFVSPLSAKELVKTETVVRNDLDRRLIPEPGTPVAVFYRGDQHFRLL